MKKRIEHTFCDHCGTMILAGERCYHMNGKDYHAKCLRAAATEYVKNHLEVIVSTAFNPFSPLPATVELYYGDEKNPRQIPMSISYSEIVVKGDLYRPDNVARAIIQKYAEKHGLQMENFKNLTIVLPESATLAFRLDMVKKLKYGSAPTQIMDASVDVWMEPKILGIYDLTFYGKEYSKYIYPQHISYDNDADGYDVVGYIIHMLALAVESDLATFSTVEDQDVTDDITAPANIPVGHVVNPRHADMTDKTSEMFNL